VRNRIILVVFMLSLLLTACSAQTPAAPTSTPTLLEATAAATETPVETATPSATATATTEPTVAITPSGPATCQVAAVIPTPDPTMQASLPAVTSADWTEGQKHLQ
jgi:uncharacterized protein YcfL